jgi:hypothetical protein
MTYTRRRRRRRRRRRKKERKKETCHLNRRRFIKEPLLP